MESLSTINLFQIGPNIPSQIITPSQLKNIVFQLKEFKIVMVVFIGRCINRTIETLSRNDIGQFIAQCAKETGKSLSTLDNWRKAGRIHEVLLSKYKHAPSPNNLQWYINFPTLETEEAMCNFYENNFQQFLVSQETPSVQDMRKAAGIFYDFFVIVLSTIQYQCETGESFNNCYKENKETFK